MLFILVRKFNIILILTAISIMHCGESKEDVTSRSILEATIRQAEIAFEDIKNNRSNEETLNLIGVRDFYKGYTDRMGALRTELAGRTLTPKFSPMRPKLDSLFTQGTLYLNSRQECMLHLFDLINSSSAYRRHLKNALKYKKEKYGKELAKSNYLSTLEESQKFGDAKIKFSTAFKKEIEIADQIKTLALDIQILGRSLGLRDSLSFQKTLTDTPDILYSSWQNIKDTELPTETITAIFNPYNHFEKLEGDYFASVLLLKFDHDPAAISKVLNGKTWLIQGAVVDKVWSDKQATFRGIRSHKFKLSCTFYIGQNAETLVVDEGVDFVGNFSGFKGNRVIFTDCVIVEN